MPVKKLNPSNMTLLFHWSKLNYATHQTPFLARPLLPVPFTPEAWTGYRPLRRRAVAPLVKGFGKIVKKNQNFLASKNPKNNRCFFVKKSNFRKISCCFKRISKIFGASRRFLKTPKNNDSFPKKKSKIWALFFNFFLMFFPPKKTLLVFVIQGSNVRLVYESISFAFQQIN